MEGQLSIGEAVAAVKSLKPKPKWLFAAGVFPWTPEMGGCCCCCGGGGGGLLLANSANKSADMLEDFKMHATGYWREEMKKRDSTMVEGLLLVHPAELHES